MPDIDVIDCLTDPDYIQPLVCTRQSQTVDGNGIATNVPETIRFFGVVTQDKGKRLERSGEAERVSGSIWIHTVFRLTAGEDVNTEAPDGPLPARSADLVTWHGRQYVVADVDPYTEYGRGFVAARCDLMPLSG